MARGGRGDRGNLEGVPLDQIEPDIGERGRGAHAMGDQGSQAPASVARKKYRTERVRLQITARRVRIDPRKKRASYIRRLERVMRACDKVIADPASHEELQVKAMSVLIRAITVCYDMVTDVEVEMLEREAEEIKRLFEEGAREGEEDPGRGEAG
jgi:hypothetical protein